MNTNTDLVVDPSDPRWDGIPWVDAPLVDIPDAFFEVTCEQVNDALLRGYSMHLAELAVVVEPDL